MYPAVFPEMMSVSNDTAACDIRSYVDAATFGWVCNWTLSKVKGTNAAPSAADELTAQHLKPRAGRGSFVVIEPTRSEKPVLAEPAVLADSALAGPFLGVLAHRDQGRSHAFYTTRPV